MALQDVGHLAYLAYGHAACEQAQQVAAGLVLQHVHGVSERNHRLAVGEYVRAGDAVLLAEIAVVAGIEQGDAGIGGDGGNFAELYERLGGVDAVGLGRLGVIEGGEPPAVQIVGLGEVGDGLFAALAVALFAAHGIADGALGRLQIAVHVHRFHRGVPPYILGVGHAVLVEQGQVYIFPLDLLDGDALDVWIHAEEVEAGPVAGLEGLGELLLQRYGLVFPGDEAVGEAAAAGEGDHAVGLVARLLLCYRLAQVLAYLLVARLAIESRFDAAGEDVALDLLTAVAGEVIVVISGAEGILGA